MQMLGVILCGGQSLRMGQDKGLLTLNQKHWAEHAYNKLRLLDIPVVISVNNNQVDDYGGIFNPEQLTVDNPALHINGPLCGVLSVHLQYPNQDVFVLACDMLKMENDLLNLLLDHYNKNPTQEAYLFLNENEPEPLCAIYRAVALEHIYQLYLAKQLSKHSMKFALEQMQVSNFPLAENQKIYFHNYNSHADINGR